MTASYTPGPWTVGEPSGLGCPTWSVYANGPLGYFGDTGHGPENAAANARLAEEVE